jgi:hypothetical protein
VLRSKPGDCDEPEDSPEADMKRHLPIALASCAVVAAAMAQPGGAASETIATLPASNLAASAPMPGASGASGAAPVVPAPAQDWNFTPRLAPKAMRR